MGGNTHGALPRAHALPREHEQGARDAQARLLPARREQRLQHERARVRHDAPRRELLPQPRLVAARAHTGHVIHTARRRDAFFFTRAKTETQHPKRTRPRHKLRAGRTAPRRGQLIT